MLGCPYPSWTFIKDSFILHTGPLITFRNKATWRMKLILGHNMKKNCNQTCSNIQWISSYNASDRQFRSLLAEWLYSYMYMSVQTEIYVWDPCFYNIFRPTAGLVESRFNLTSLWTTFQSNRNTVSKFVIFQPGLIFFCCFFF